MFVPPYIDDDDAMISGMPGATSSVTRAVAFTLSRRGRSSLSGWRSRAPVAPARWDTTSALRSA